MSAQISCVVSVLIEAPQPLPADPIVSFPLSTPPLQWPSSDPGLLVGGKSGAAGVPNRRRGREGLGRLQPRLHPEGPGPGVGGGGRQPFPLPVQPVVPSPNFLSRGPPGPRQARRRGPRCALLGARPARLRQTVSWRLSNVPGATDGRWHQGHPCRNTGSHHCFPAPTRRQAHRGCDSPKSHSVLVTSVTPRSPRLSSRHPGRPQLSLKARWLSRILCALGRSLACSDLRLLESIDVSLPSPHKHLLSACCMLTLWSQSGHTATA